MVQYNPKEWFGLIFKFHKSDTFRKLFWVILSVSLYSWVVIYIELEVFEMNFTSTVMHSLLGFVISLLLVFRTNTAYERWWEGRKQWGALVNVSRSFAFKCAQFIGQHGASASAEIFKLIRLYPFVLKEHLRQAEYDQLDDARLQDLRPFLSAAHVPNALAMSMQQHVWKQSAAGSLNHAQELAMIEDLNRFTDICGACERIKRTPIPYTYNIFIKKFVFVYILTMPIGFAATFEYWTILITAFTFYTFASLELIAESIEDPFGLDSDDLPTDDLAATIEQNIREIEASVG
jgi:putative membrane protein